MRSDLVGNDDHKHKTFYSALAQLVEQLTVNQRVAGSSPAGGANIGAADKDVGRLTLSRSGEAGAGR